MAVAFLRRTSQSVPRFFIAVGLLCCITCVFCGCEKKSDVSSSDVASHTAAPDLVIYSPHSTDKTEFIVREFRQRTGLKVSVVYEGTGELLARLAAEEEHGVCNADVFWGGGIESLEAAKELFAPYISPQTAFIDRSYIDPDYYWTGFSVMTMVIVYNTNLVAGDLIPSGWNDLLNPFFKNRLFMPDPLRSGSAYSILNALLASNAESSGDGWEFIRSIKAQAGEGGIASSSSSVHPAVASGEFFAGLTSEDAALSLINTGSPLAVVYPIEGTLAVPDGVALVKNAPHVDAAKLFIDFVLSPDVQKIAVSRWFRRSVRTDVPLPQGAQAFDGVHIMPYDTFVSARKRNRLLEIWKNL